MCQCYKSCVYKIRLNGQTLVDVMWFLDNRRVTGPRDYICWYNLHVMGRQYKLLTVVSGTST